MTVTTEPPPPNPWRTTWFSPRRTIRAIVDAEVRPSWIPVVALAALTSTFTAFQVDPDGSLSISQSMFTIALRVAQFVYGILIGPFLLAFVGGWLGGEADPDDIRPAIAWSYLPLIAAGAVWLPPMLMIFGIRGLAPAAVALAGPLSLGQSLVLAIVGLFQAAASVWCFILEVAMLAEVQRFSIWRATASVIILLVPLLLLAAMT